MNLFTTNFLIILGTLLLIISMYMLFQNIYTLFLSLFGYGDIKKDYAIMEDKTKFLILIAAHNEESVIKNTIQNIKKIKYNPALFDIYVVNDNSTDRTQKICEEIKIPHINTSENLFKREGVGKPAGIQYALRYLGFENLKNKYDMLVILDADNYVDSTILTELNSQWQQKGKPEAIQTYLDSKNTSSFMAIGYTSSYWINNRFFQLSKYRLGLPNSIGGTGFAVRIDWLLNNGGFSYKSLTEDLEMEIEIVKSGGKIIWNHFARIYDEKPDGLMISLRQRTRWAQGHWYVAFLNFKPLIKLWFKDKFKFSYIDQLLYLFGMGRGIQFILIILIFSFLSILMLVSNVRFNMVFTKQISFLINVFIPTTLINIILFIYSYFVLPIYAAKKDGRKVNLFKVIIGTAYVGITYIYTQAIGFFKCRNQGVWIKTPHKYTSKN